MILSTIFRGGLHGNPVVHGTMTIKFYCSLVYTTEFYLTCLASVNRHSTALLPSSQSSQSHTIQTPLRFPSAACVEGGFNHQSQLAELCLCGLEGKSRGPLRVLTLAVALPIFTNSEGRPSLCILSALPHQPRGGPGGGAAAPSAGRNEPGRSPLARSRVALGKYDCWINKSPGRLTRKAD